MPLRLSSGCLCAARRALLLPRKDDARDGDGERVRDARCLITPDTPTARC